MHGFAPSHPHVRKWLAEWAEKNNHDLYQDGFTIVTTLDTRLQAMASQAVARQADLLQQIADVEWSAPTLRVVSTSPEAYAKARPKVDPFGHLWNKRRDLVAAPSSATRPSSGSSLPTRSTTPQPLHG